MSVVPPNRSQTGWPRGVNQFGNKYIQQSKPLTLERTINLYFPSHPRNFFSSDSGDPEDTDKPPKCFKDPQKGCK